MHFDEKCNGSFIGLNLRNPEFSLFFFGFASENKLRYSFSSILLSIDPCDEFRFRPKNKNKLNILTQNIHFSENSRIFSDKVFLVYVGQFQVIQQSALYFWSVWSSWDFFNGLGQNIL